MVKKQQQQNRVIKENKSANSTMRQQYRVEIIYYTDPLCCWSWAMEQHWQRLTANFKDAIEWRYCMGGLLPDWKKYNDQLNAVSRPVQMAPVWLHAGQSTGVHIEHRLWIKDPPASSYTACIAVKCAALQSFEAGEKYLYALREVCMLQGFNIARYDVLLALANELAKTLIHFDVEQFKTDLNNGNGLEAFRKDLQEVKYYSIHRFPTFIMKQANGKALAITGYRPYDTLEAALMQLME